MNALVLMSSALVAGDMPPAAPPPAVMAAPVQSAPVPLAPMPAAPAHVIPAPATGCDGCGAVAPAACSTCQEKPNLLSKLRARFGSGSKWKGKKGDCDCPPACDCAQAAPTGCALPPAPVMAAPVMTAPTIMPAVPPTVIQPVPAPKAVEPAKDAPKKDTTEKKSSQLAVPTPLVVPAGTSPKPVTTPLGGSGSPF